MQNHSYSRIFLFGVAGMLIVSGCSSEKEAARIDRSVSASQVMSRVNAVGDSLQTFSAEGSISIDSPRLSQSAGFQLDVKGHDSTRIIIEGPFGITLAKVLLTRENFIAYNAIQNSVYEGSLRDGLSKLPNMTVSPGIIVDAFSGVRRFDTGQTPPDSFFIVHNSYIFKFRDDKGWKTYSVDGTLFRIVRVEALDKNDHDLIRREEYEYSRTGNGTVELASARIFLPKDDTQIEISFSSVMINRTLQGMMISFPDDVSRVMLQ